MRRPPLPGRSRLLPAALLVAAALAAPVGGGHAQAQGQPQAKRMPVSEEGYQGWKMFHVYCYRCHGTDAVANPGLPGPDLRKSVQALSDQDFQHVVKDGRLPKGMPAWGELLTDQQVKQIRSYLEVRASGVLKPGRPDEQ